MKLKGSILLDVEAFTITLTSIIELGLLMGLDINQARLTADKVGKEKHGYSAQEIFGIDLSSPKTERSDDVKVRH